MLGLEVRAGLHTGECEAVLGKLGGIAVHIGARVAAAAGPGEILVSSTVKDLVAGSGLRFTDPGTRALGANILFRPDAYPLATPPHEEQPRVHNERRCPLELC